ncbi:MAG: hypothetical protein RR875_00165 [Clostridium sp.]
MTEAEKQKKIRNFMNFGGEVQCQGCGIRIAPDDNMREIVYVKTKRKTERFFHEKCKDLVWRTKIK